MAQQMEAAYREPEYAVATAALEPLADRLEGNHPGGPASLRGGLDETLTMHRLGLAGLLQVCLAATNTVASGLSVVQNKLGRVKRWRSGQRVEQWVGMDLLGAAASFRRIRRYRLTPLLQGALRRAIGAQEAVSEPALATGCKN